METEKNGLSASGLEVRTRSGWKLRASDCTTVHGPSMTVQHQGFSISDLLQRHTKGMTLVPEHEGINLGQELEDQDFEQLARADIFEREQALKANTSRANIAQEKLKKGGSLGGNLPPTTTPPPNQPPPPTT